MLSRQKMAFGEGVNLIYSTENSQGKTTLIRILLFIMGFKVSPTKGVVFDSMEYRMVIENAAGKELCISRLWNDDNNYVHVKCEGRDEKRLYGEHYDFVRRRVYEGMSLDLMENILGVFYIDQEKGWTMLNRGKVIGSISFNVESFLRALGEVDIKNELIELKKIDEDIAQYKKLQNFVELEREVQREAGETAPDSVQERFNSKLNILKSEILYCEREKKSLDSIQGDNKSIARIVDDLRLSILVKGERVQVRSSNVEGLKDTIAILDIRRKALQNRLVDLKRQYQKAMDERDAYESALHSDDLLMMYKRKIASIHLNQMHIDDAIDSLKRRRKKLNAIVKAANSNAWTKNIGQLVMLYLECFSARYNYLSDDNVALTSDLYPFTGAEMSKRVLAFRLAYVNAVREKTGIILPIIIDSPYSKETDSFNFTRFIDVIRQDFRQHQIFIASIHKGQIDKCNMLTLDGGLLDGRVHMQFVPESKTYSESRPL